MADIDLDQNQVRAGAEALQREDWENNKPLTHYVPVAETVLEAADQVPPRQITTEGELEDLGDGSMLQCPHGCKIAVLNDEHGFPEYHVSGEDRPWDGRRIILEHAPLTVLFEAEA